MVEADANLESSSTRVEDASGSQIGPVQKELLSDLFPPDTFAPDTIAGLIADSPDVNMGEADAYRQAGIDFIADTITNKFIPPGKLRAMMYVLGYPVTQEYMAYLLDAYVQSAYQRTLAELYHREFPHDIVWDYESMALHAQMELEQTAGDGDWFDSVNAMGQELKDRIRDDMGKGIMPVAYASLELTQAGFYTQRPFPEGANIFVHATDTALSPYQVLAFCECEPKSASSLFERFANIRPNQKLMLFTDGPSDQPAIERQLVSDSLKAQYIPFIIPTMVHTDRDLYSSLVAQFKQRTGCEDSATFAKKYSSGATRALASIDPQALFGEGSYANPDNDFALAEFFIHVKNYWNNAVFFVSADAQVPGGLREQKSIIYLADSKQHSTESFATTHTYVLDAKTLKMTADKHLSTIDEAVKSDVALDVRFHKEAYTKLEDSLRALAPVAAQLPEGDNCLGRVTKGSIVDESRAVRFVEIETVFDEGNIKSTNPTRIRYLYGANGNFLRIEYFVYETRNWLEKPKQGVIAGKFSSEPAFFTEQRWFYDLPKVIEHMSQLEKRSKREAELFATMQSVTKALEQSPNAHTDPRFAKAVAALSGLADYMGRVGERRAKSRFTLGPVASERLVKRFKTGDDDAEKFFFYVTPDAATIKEGGKERSFRPPFQVMVYEEGLRFGYPSGGLAPTTVFAGEYRAGNDQVCYPCDDLNIISDPETGTVIVQIVVDTQFFELNLDGKPLTESAPWMYVDGGYTIPPLDFDPVDFLAFFSGLVREGFDGRPLAKERKPSAAAALYHQSRLPQAKPAFVEGGESFKSSMFQEATEDTTTYFGAQYQQRLPAGKTAAPQNFTMHKPGMRRFRIQLQLSNNGLAVSLI